MTGLLPCVLNSFFKNLTMQTNEGGEVIQTLLEINLAFDIFQQSFKKNIIRGSTGMPSVTVIVSAGPGWSTT
jgi:hypothetical protein